MGYLEAIENAVVLFRNAQSILFVTGAGVSADSGLPTYRGVGGLYDGRVTEDGLTIEQALSGSVFRSHPEITWKYLAQMEFMARGKTYNAAHEAIVYFEKNWPRVWTLTQNIDGFHLSAGAQNVLEIHGTLRRLRCPRCATMLDVVSYENVSLPPRCSNCGGGMRPDVVLFDEMLPTDILAKLDQELNRGFDLVVSVGTSSQFPYILEPIYRAIQNGKATLEINPAVATDISGLVTLHLCARAAEALPEIQRRCSQD